MRTCLSRRKLMDFLQNLKGEYLRMLKTGKEVMS